MNKINKILIIISSFLIISLSLFLIIKNNKLQKESLNIKETATALSNFDDKKIANKKEFISEQEINSFTTPKTIKTNKKINDSIILVEENSKEISEEIIVGAETEEIFDETINDVSASVDIILEEKIEEEIKIEAKDEKTKEQKEVIKEENKVVVPQKEYIYTSQDYMNSSKSWNLVDNEEFVKIDSEQYYVLYDTKQISVEEYDANYNLLTTNEYNVENGFYIAFNANTKYVKTNSAFFVSSAILTNNKLPQKKLDFYVCSPNSPVAFSISTAVSFLKNGGTILVLPGTYEEYIEGFGKVINLYGVDKNLCTIVGYDADYYNPPIEFGAGNLTNLTIKAVNNNSPSSTKDVQFKAYGLHVEDNNLCDRTLTIDNCIISSDFRQDAGIGMGLRRGTVTIKNSLIYGLFVHDSDNEKYGGTQNLIINNSNVYNSFCLNSLNKPSADVRLFFTNNNLPIITSCNSDGNTYNGYLGLMNFTLCE